jgi:hypothetical protein
MPSLTSIYPTICLSSFKADHALSKSVIEKDPRYKDFEITWSNEGY